MTEANIIQSPRQQMIEDLLRVIAHNSTLSSLTQQERQTMSSQLNQLNRYNQPYPDGTLDDVIKYLITTKTPNLPKDVQNKNYESAFYLLCNKLDYYTKMLGDLLPSWLVDQVRHELDRRAYVEGANHSAADDLEQYIEHMMAPGSKAGGFATGISKIDDALGGGLHGIVVALGETGTGKTCLSIWMSLSALMDDPDVACVFFSEDLSRPEVMDRFLSAHLNTEIVSRKGIPNKDELRRSLTLGKASEILERLLIKDRTFSSQLARSTAVNDIPPDDFDSSGNIIRVIKQSHARTHCKKIFVCIDMFPKMTLPKEVSSDANSADAFRLDQIAQIQNFLRGTFGEGNYCIMLTCELRKNNSSSERSIPQLADAKGTTRITSDADVVFCMGNVKEIDEKTNSMSLCIAKGRAGVHRGSHDVLFHHTVSRFSEAPSKTEASQIRESRKKKTSEGSQPSNDTGNPWEK